MQKPPLQQLKQESLVQNMNQRPVTQGIETGSMAFDKSMPEMADRPITTAGGQRSRGPDKSFHEETGNLWLIKINFLRF